MFKIDFVSITPSMVQCTTVVYNIKHFVNDVYSAYREPREKQTDITVSKTNSYFSLLYPKSKNAMSLLFDVTHNSPAV